MNLDTALDLLKNAPEQADSWKAMDVLRAHPLVVARFERTRWDETRQAPRMPVRTHTVGDDQRAAYEEHLTLYRWAAPELRAGRFWETSPWWARIQAVGNGSPQHVMWRTTVRASDSRVLAEFKSVSGRYGGEFVLDAESLDIEPN